MGVKSVLNNLIASGEYKSEEDFAKKNCTAIEWTGWWVGGMATCVTRYNGKKGAGAVVTPVVNALAEDTGYNDRQERLEKERKATEAAIKAKDENVIKAGSLVEEIMVLKTKFNGILAKEGEIILKKDYDKWISELNAVVAQMTDIVTKMKSIMKQAKEANTGIVLDYGYSDIIEPLLKSVQTVQMKSKDTVDTKIPTRMTFDQKEPLFVLDSQADTYEKRRKLEESCKTTAKELDDLGVLKIEGCELSSEGKRKLQAISSCYVKAKIVEDYPDNIKQYQQKNKECNSGNNLAGAGSVIGGVFVFVLLLSMFRRK